MYQQSQQPQKRKKTEASERDIIDALSKLTDTELLNLQLSALNGENSLKDQFSDLMPEADIMIDIKRACKSGGTLADLKSFLEFQFGDAKLLRRGMKDQDNYRSAKNLLLSVRYCLLKEQERVYLSEIVANEPLPVLPNKSLPLSMNTVKNYLGYIGTSRFKMNISYISLLLKNNKNGEVEESDKMPIDTPK